jgi:transposase
VSKMAKKKVYDEDFKKMIVELYENKKPICELKREYGLCDASLYRWIKEYGKIKTETGEVTNNHEIKRLKKENLKLKEELEILKKAIAIFTPR